MNKPKFGPALLSIVITGTALAQTPAGTGTGTVRNPLLRPAPTIQFGSIDANHDGRVSREEAQAYGELTAAWSTLDADHDTYLSAPEFGKWKAPASGDGSKVEPGSSSPQNADDAKDASTPQNATDSEPRTSTPQNATDSNRGPTSPESATEAR